MVQNKQPNQNQSTQQNQNKLPDQGQNQTQHPDQLQNLEKAKTPDADMQEPKTDRERAQHQDRVRVGREDEKTRER